MRCVGGALNGERRMDWADEAHAPWQLKQGELVCAGPPLGAHSGHPTTGRITASQHKRCLSGGTLKRRRPRQRLQGLRTANFSMPLSTIKAISCSQSRCVLSLHSTERIELFHRQVQGATAKVNLTLRWESPPLRPMHRKKSDGEEMFQSWALRLFQLSSASMLHLG